MAEGRGIAEPAGKGNAPHRVLLGAQHVFGGIHPHQQQVLLGRDPFPALEYLVQVRTVYAHVSGQVSYLHRVAVIVLDIVHRFPEILLLEGGLVLPLFQLGHGPVKAAQDPVFPVSSLLKLPDDGLHAPAKLLRPGNDGHVGLLEPCAAHRLLPVDAVKGHPHVLPGSLPVRLVIGHLRGLDEKRLPRLYRVGDPSHGVGPLPGDYKMEQILGAHRRAEAVAAGALLIAAVVHGNGFGHGLLCFPHLCSRHGRSPLSFRTPEGFASF